VPRNIPEQGELNPFGSPSYEAWRELAERDLAGAPFNVRLVKRVAGIDVLPLYTAREQPADDGSLPGSPPYRRGGRPPSSVRNWEIAQEVAHSDPERALTAAREAIAGGASWLALALEDPRPVLEAVPLETIGVLLTPGRGALPAQRFVEHVEQRGLDPARLSGCLGLDPLGTWAARGVLPKSLGEALEEACTLARWASSKAPGVRALLVNGSVYHEASADAARELGVVLATALAYLRVLTEAGLTLNAACSTLAFELAIGTDFFLELAKLRAARVCWSKVVALCGGDAAAQRPFTIARGSRRTLTRRDAWVNLLRGTSESFAAVAGGADVVITPALTDALGESDALGARLARNTQHLLEHEAELGRVADPAGGSFYVEALTDALARKAWAELSALERAGGIAQVLMGGKLQRELADALAAERRAVETRRVPITGVSEFAWPDERVPAYHPIDDATVTPRVSLPPDAAPSAPAVCTPLITERLAEPFEELRAHADELTRERGQRPRVFLANLGPIAAHKARATFAQGYFEAGGFAVLGNDGFATPAAAAAAFAASGAELVALCSSDALYAELATEAARALAAHRPRALVLAGNPGAKEAEYRAAGVTDFVFLGSNVTETLSLLLDRVGGVRW
jgi:methylmalonyl-CoA mutase